MKPERIKFVPDDDESMTNEITCRDEEENAVLDVSARSDNDDSDLDDLGGVS